MAWRDRETYRERQRRRDTKAGIKGRGFVTGSADTKDVEQMMNRLLDMNSKEGKKAVKHASRMALELIDDETREEVWSLKLQNSGKGWRKAFAARSAFKYKLRRVKSNSFWFYSAVNYKNKILRISHLVEKGFAHVAGVFVPGNGYRKKAFRTKRNKALKVLELNLLLGLDYVRRGKAIPNITNWRKVAPRG